MFSKGFLFRVIEIRGNEFRITIVYCLPFPKQEILDSSKLKEFSDDNFKFD